jgi:hypothetical protein
MFPTQQTSTPPHHPKSLIHSPAALVHSPLPPSHFLMNHSPLLLLWKCVLMSVHVPPGLSCCWCAFIRQQMHYLQWWWQHLDDNHSWQWWQMPQQGQSLTNTICGLLTTTPC